MRQQKFCPHQQQYYNAKSFSVYVLAIEEVEKYALYMNTLNKAHEFYIRMIALHYFCKFYTK